MRVVICLFVFYWKMSVLSVLLLSFLLVHDGTVGFCFLNQYEQTPQETGDKWNKNQIKALYRFCQFFPEGRRLWFIFVGAAAATAASASSTTGR